ncbi:MAG: M23 family metallopeptidase, partial [Acidobacteria bacterium]|nr:M23 family metallopeptidase [Acidobacteriota bacterium]
MPDPEDIFEFSPAPGPAKRGPLPRGPKKLRVTGEYNDPRDGGRRRHHALDYGFAEGTPLAINRPGKVVKVGKDAKSGLYVKIDHGDGLESSYAHLKDTKAAVGDVILPGDPFAHTGKSATSKAHLHQVTRRGGVRVDPRSVGIQPIGPSPPSVPTFEFDEAPIFEFAGEDPPPPTALTTA